MPRVSKKTITYKYKCLEPMCRTVHRQDKWIKHCETKHIYKSKNDIAIPFKIIEVKEGNGSWKPYIDPSNRNYERERDAPAPSTSTKQ